MDTYLDGNRKFIQTHQQNIKELYEQQERTPRRPVGYDPEKLKRLTMWRSSGWELDKKWELDGGSPPQDQNKIFIGERGGRYYKRRRADGTTYREYTW